MTNKQFAQTNEQFIADCKAANIPPTTRQASKYDIGKGLAYAIKCQRIRNEIFKPRHSER
jgi:hypothetical protein